MTNKILTHICLVYGRPLPGRLQSVALQRLVNTAVKGGDVKQHRTFQRELERNSDLSGLLKLQIVKQESIESEVQIMRDNSRSRSSHEMLTSKMRRRVRLNKGRKKRINVPQLDLVKRVVSKRKFTDELETSLSLDSSNNVRKPCTEKPPESKRRKVAINNAKLPVNPFDLTSMSQPYTRNVKAQKKAKRMSRNERNPLIQRNTLKPFQQNQNRGYNFQDHCQYVTEQKQNMNSTDEPLFVFGGGGAKNSPDPAMSDKDYQLSFCNNQLSLPNQLNQLSRLNQLNQLNFTNSSGSLGQGGFRNRQGLCRSFNSNFFN